MVVSYGSRLREPCSRQEDVIGLAGVVSMFRMTGSAGDVGGTRLCDSSKSTPFLKNCYNDNDLTLRWHRGLEKDSAGAVGAQVCRGGGLQRSGGRAAPRARSLHAHCGVGAGPSAASQRGGGPPLSARTRLPSETSTRAASFPRGSLRGSLIGQPPPDT